MTGLSQDEQDIVDTVREFVDREVRPVARELEHANEYPEKLIGQMKQLGIFGLAIPEPYGDVQVSMPCYAMITEELARGWMSLAGAMGGHTVVAKLLVTYGTEEQKQRYLPRMATGELRATMALAEPGGGSDLQAMQTTAVLVDDGLRRGLRGQRVQDVDHQRAAVRADRVAVQDRSGRAAAAPGHQHPAGRARRGPHRVTGPAASSGTRAWKRASWSSPATARPRDAILGGAEGAGFAQMMKGLETGRIQVASRALGVAAAAFEDSLRYAQRTRGVRPADLEAPVDRQLPGRHGHPADRRAAAGPVRGGTFRRGRAVRPGGRHGQAVRVGGRHADRAHRGPDPRRLRLLDRIRRGAVLPGRAADDRRGRHQRDPAERDRVPADQPGRPGSGPGGSSGAKRPGR